MNRSYVHTLAVALDQLAAAVFFNRPDLTISALARVVQLSDSEGAEWGWKVSRLLKLNRWQIAALRCIGRALNFTFANHCEAARLSDLTRAGGVIKLLGD